MIRRPMTRESVTGRALTLLLLLGCAAYDEAPSSPSVMSLDREKAEEGAGGAPAPEPAAAAAPKKMRARRAEVKADKNTSGEDGFFADEEMEEEPADDDAGARTRSWFPESFLFAPEVVTDGTGRAVVDVTVPDRLTTWRVLGLAHSRSGGLAGDVLRFTGTLPTYVEPVVPDLLRVGDRLELPVQVVNTTDGAVSGALRVTASGGADHGMRGPIVVPASGSILTRIPLSVERAETITLRAGFGDADAVEHTIEVVPTGRPVIQRSGGALGAPRTVALPTTSASAAALVVFPGGKTVLRSEVSERVGEGAAAAAHALIVSAHGAALSVPTSEDSKLSQRVRKQRIVATQRAMAAARIPSLAVARVLAPAALHHPEDPVLTRLGERLVDGLVSQQRPDGSFGGDTRETWTVQRLVVSTAETVRALRAAAERSERARKHLTRVELLARAAIERHRGQVDDPYTAAAVLASGLAGSELAEELDARLRKGLVPDERGGLRLELSEGVVRADGRAPTVVDGASLAALALDGRADTAGLLADLGGTLLGNYTPRRGWGDGVTDLRALEATLALFTESPPEGVVVTLSADGAVVARGTFDDQVIHGRLSLLGEVSGAESWTIAAEPPTAGLGFSLTVTAWEAWTDPPTGTGLELMITPPANPRVGKPGELQISGAAPAGKPLVVSVTPPAGVEISGLDDLQRRGALTGFEADEREVRLNLPPLAPGALIDLELEAIPTLRGRLSSGPVSLRIADDEREITVPPTVWEVR